jgi:hypothetical protein
MEICLKNSVIMPKSNHPLNWKFGDDVYIYIYTHTKVLSYSQLNCVKVNVYLLESKNIYIYMS